MLWEMVNPECSEHGLGSTLLWSKSLRNRMIWEELLGAISPCRGFRCWMSSASPGPFLPVRRRRKFSWGRRRRRCVKRRRGFHFVYPWMKVRRRQTTLKLKTFPLPRDSLSKTWKGLHVYVISLYIYNFLYLHTFLFYKKNCLRRNCCYTTLR